MTFEKILEILDTFFSKEVVTSHKANVLMPWVEVSSGRLIEVMQFLKNDSNLYFDSLSCITAIDLGVEAGIIELVYNLYSIPYEHKFCVKIKISRDLEECKAPSLSSVWKTADWQEREVFDFFGIQFDEHPDLRRIFLPADWEGYPLRKDYAEVEKYHEIKIAY
jgi:NADH-quinone oxidoreductase subunit C